MHSRFLIDRELSRSVPSNQFVRKKGVAEPHLFVVADIQHAHPVQHAIVDRAHQRAKLFLAAFLEEFVQAIHGVFFQRPPVGQASEFVNAQPATLDGRASPPNLQAGL